MANNARVNRSLRRLGLGDLETGRIERFLAADAEDAAELVRLALQRFVDQIKSGSDSGILNGYEAVKQKGNEIGVSSKSVKRRLKRSGAEIAGDFDWIVYVDAPSSSGGYSPSKEFNLFNILDAGRPRLKKLPLGKAYPLFGAGSDRLRRRVGGSGGASIAQPAKTKSVGGKKVARRKSALRDGYFHTFDPDKESIVFSRGPLKAVQAQNLYKRALKQAKDDLSGSGFKDWDLIYVGPLRN